MLITGISVQLPQVAMVTLQRHPLFAKAVWQTEVKVAPLCPFLGHLMERGRAHVDGLEFGLFALLQSPECTFGVHFNNDSALKYIREVLSCLICVGASQVSVYTDEVDDWGEDINYFDVDIFQLYYQQPIH